MTDLSLIGDAYDDAISKKRKCRTQGRKIRYYLGLAELPIVSSTDGPVPLVLSPLALSSEDQV